MKNIVVPIDFSSVTQRVVDMTEKLAAAFNSRIRLIHVVDTRHAPVDYQPGPQYRRDKVAETFKEEHEKIQQMADDLRQKNLDATALLIQGGIVEKILKEIDKYEPDVVVMGTHGHRALFKLVMGGISEGVLRKSRFPVLFVPSDTQKEALNG